MAPVNWANFPTAKRTLSLGCVRSLNALFEGIECKWNSQAPHCKTYFSISHHWLVERLFIGHFYHPQCVFGCGSYHGLVICKCRHLNPTTPKKDINRWIAPNDKRELPKGPWKETSCGGQLARATVSGKANTNNVTVW